MKVEGFNWDAGNKRKGDRHGIPIEMIEDFFRGQVWVGPDPKHSSAEMRFLAVGRSIMGKAMVVAFTFREIEGRKLVRPISARYMHKREARKYEEAFSKIEE